MFASNRNKGGWRGWAALVGQGVVVVVLLVAGAHSVLAFAPAGKALTSGTPLAIVESLVHRVRGEASDTAITRGSAPGVATPGRFTTESFVGRGMRMTYYLFVPRDYTPTKTYPVVLILHGTGERAKPGQSVAANRDRLLSQAYVQAFVSPSAQAMYPSFVVVPQIEGDTARWVNTSGGVGTFHLAATPSISLQAAVDIVATVAHSYSGIDPNRRYIAGISMGAFGVWDAIERWPSYFAAAAPISGAGDPTRVRAIAQLPIWDFHGTADANVPVAGSRAMHAALVKVGGRACYTEYPGKAHNLWVTVRVYNSPTFLAWLFGQTRAPSQGQMPPSCHGEAIGGVPAK